jgi:carbonic anhydrase
VNTVVRYPGTNKVPRYLTASLDIFKTIMIPATEALKQLKLGNERFVSDNTNFRSIASKRIDLLSGQHPKAIILGCSDSRVPAEIIFDQDLGDLFIIRIAGNIVLPSQLGSIEFAIEQLGIKLIIVLGHTQCGAIKAAIEVTKNAHIKISNHMNKIINIIRNVILRLHEKLNIEIDNLGMNAIIRANIINSMNQIRYRSQIIKELLKKKEISIVGAEYNIETGIVHFYE